MDEWALARVAEWETEPFQGGISGLHRLADAAFSGAVEVDRTWLMFLNGRLIGRWGGAIDSIGDQGTIHHAPDSSLPLLLVMVSRNGTREGSYYTEETPLESVHQTLEEANFTGYVELSDNVLSGDYYVVYYGGRSFPVAFVGASERCITGSDAFERAADEVGIYEVRSVDIEVESLPDAPDSHAPAPDQPASEPTPPADPDVESEPPSPPTTEESPSKPPGLAPENADTEESWEQSPTTNWTRADVERGGTGDGQPAVQAIPSIDPDLTAATPLGIDAEGASTPAESSDAPTDEPAAAASSDDAERMAEKRDQLADEVETLEAKLDELHADVGATPEQAAPVGRAMSAEDALHDSNLFVRYGTRGGPTLERAVAGKVPSPDVADNLLLERHTGFEDKGTTVDGVQFATFFDDRLEVRFTRWLLEELLVEIDRTNSRSALADLVASLARIDRIDFLEPLEAVEDHRFDIVARDRMGEPVLVADVDPGRSATTQETMTELIKASTEVAAAYPDLGAAVVVTESYFEPGALGAAEEATSNSLLSRSDKENYVRVARGVGYHLCLVECRSETFHVTSPTL